jgi:hypothetical protein
MIEHPSREAYNIALYAVSRRLCAGVNNSAIASDIPIKEIVVRWLLYKAYNIFLRDFNIKVLLVVKDNKPLVRVIGNKVYVIL